MRAFARVPLEMKRGSFRVLIEEMEEWDEKADPLVVAGIQGEKIFKLRGGVSMAAQVPECHRPAVHRSENKPGLPIGPPIRTLIAPARSFAGDDFVVRREANLPISVLKLHIRQLDARRRAVGITGESGPQQRDLLAR